MSEFSTLLFGLALACSGLACWRFSQERRAKFVPALRLAGALLLSGSLGFSLRQMGDLAGFAAFCGSLTAGVVSLAFLQPRFPRVAEVMGIGSLIGALLLLVAHKPGAFGF